MSTLSTVDIQNIWKCVLESVKSQIPDTTFKTWFSNTYPLRIDGDRKLVIGVQNDFVRSWLIDKYINVLNSEVSKQNDFIKAVKIIVSKRKKPGSTVKKGNQTENIGLDLDTVDKISNLNSRFVFKEFVVAPHNKFAHAAAQAVTERLGVGYNPIFIYGPSGVGKTHLIQAIGNKIRALYPKMKTRYITSEAFLESYVTNIKANSLEEFRREFKSIEVLIIDDVQFFSRKIQASIELFHIFNHLHNNNLQIIFSADCHPGEISDIEDRTRTRFSSGMIIDIQKPDLDSLSIILKEKADRANISIDDSCINYIVNNINPNIREIEGVLKNIEIYQKVNGKPVGAKISLLELKGFLKNNIKIKSPITSSEVVEKVCQYFEIKKDLILGKSRKKEVVKVRQLIMYVLREFLDEPYSTIGKKMGNKDHTTVMYSVDKIKSELEDNKKLQDELSYLRKILDLN